MTPQDVNAVMEIETVSFSAPWSARAYDYELRYNANAHYYVVHAPNGLGLASAEPGSFWQRLLGRKPTTLTAATQPLLGYAGFWMMVDEAHVSTIAAHPHWRRHGIGELLLLALIDRATEIGAHSVTLEVRVSNVGAQTLYRKYGFETTGMRKRYYSDNNEDALIMTTPLVTTIEYQLVLHGLKGALFKRLAG